MFDLAALERADTAMVLLSRAEPVWPYTKPATLVPDADADADTDTEVGAEPRPAAAVCPFAAVRAREDAS
ncbi:MAG: hypothetical protein AAGE13_01075 [Pseudomonadota bacterium]